MEQGAQTETLIIGGGLSGLYAASLLHARGLSFRLLEARPRFGGRIMSARHAEHSFDLGPSWFWPDTQPRFARLVEECGLSHFAQHTDGDALLENSLGVFTRHPQQEVDPRRPRRISDGTRSVVNALVQKLPTENLLSSHRVRTITRENDHVVVTVETQHGQEDHFAAARVILALPPRLIASSLSFSPLLPTEVLAFLRATPTWMAGDAKFFALYDSPFWRSEGLSGSAYSEAGPLSDVHDATTMNGQAALHGFLIPDREQRLRLGDELIPMCLKQLVRTFGSVAASPQETFLQDWAIEPFTATPMDVPIFEHPEYGLPSACYGLWDKRLRFAGTEAAPENGGYMEGALEAAESAVAD